MCRESSSLVNAHRYDSDVSALLTPRKPVGRMSDCGRAIIASQPTSVLQTTSAPLTPRSASPSDYPQLGRRHRSSHSVSLSPRGQPLVNRETSASSAPASLLPSRAPSSEGVRSSSSARVHLHRDSVGLPSIFKVLGHLLRPRPENDSDPLEKDIHDTFAGLSSPDSSMVLAPFPFKEPDAARRAPPRVCAARARCLGLRPRRGGCNEMSPRNSPVQLWNKSSWPSQCRSSVASNDGTVVHKNAVLTSVAEDANERPYMEDGHAVCDALLVGDSIGDSWGYYAVFDGHGGRKAVQHCEERLHHLVAAELRVHPNADSSAIRSSLSSAFRKADEEVNDLSSPMNGCTATVALARRLPQGGVELHVGNVGDSRALLVGSFGTKRLSIDHRSTELAEAVRVRHRGGFICNNRVGGSLSVTRSIGDHYLKPGVSCEPDVLTHTGQCRDEAVALVIASDGLWDVVSDDEVQEVMVEYLGKVARVPDEQKAAALAGLQASVANTLVQRAKAHQSRDNILVLVAFF